MSNSDLTTLGAFSFKVDGIAMPGPATRKARALMTFLVMNRNVESARERLLDMFWPDAEPDRARDSLKTALWSIRRCLRTGGVDDDQFMKATKSTVCWTADTSVDAVEFAELSRRPETAQRAVEIFRGDFLEGDYDNWTVAERERLASMYESLLATAVKTSKNVEAAKSFIERNPYSEDAYVALIEAEVTAGRRASAASWVERCRNALAEVGEAPSDAFHSRFGGLTQLEPIVPDALTLPFAGRANELGSLIAKITGAASGRGSVMLLHGEAGVGKSTLLDRVADSASRVGLRVLHIRCSSDIPTAFGPWPGVYSGLHAGDFDSFVRSRAADVTSAVAQAIWVQLDAPSVIIVDNVQELTGDALEIFIDLARVAASRDAVIAGSRPEGVAVMRARLEDLEIEEIQLGRLGHDDLRWALTLALGNEQPEVLELLYQRSGGHPLFFVGLLNALVDEHSLTRNGREWRLVKRMNAAQKLPETVKRYIETRLQARGDTPRRVACALALEPPAHAKDLALVLQLEEPTVLDALDDLLSLGLITQPPAGAQFSFTHDLIREIAALGLNAGRRVALHHAFAQQLSTSDEREAPLRLAGHLEAAGEHLLAAQSYLKAAEVALELNAAQDAVDRCDAGIRATDKLERSSDRDHVLAKLYRTSARAAIATGDADDGTKRAREAVAAARATGDISELGRASLDLATIEGATFQTSEQNADAAEAARSATLCADEELQGYALVQVANAARLLGQRDQALLNARSAADLARRTRQPDLAMAMLDELLRTHVTWWQFVDAMDVAREGLSLARHASPLAEAAFRQARGTLWYLLERFDEALTELEISVHVADEAATRRHGSQTSPVYFAPMLLFMDHYMSAKIAGERRDWGMAIAAAQRASALTSVARLPRYAQALSLLRIDTLLLRNLPGDSDSARELAAALDASPATQGIVGWSDCTELARARVAARGRTTDASDLLRRALNVLEANAHQTPLEADRAFERLAVAAKEIGEDALAERARQRSAHYGSHRRAAANHTGGELELPASPDVGS
jgi:DNA-binding SARP family transcriptional activator